MADLKDMLFLNSMSKLYQGWVVNFYQTLLDSTSFERSHMYSREAIIKAEQGAWSLDEYIAYLSQAYHHVKHTVPLLMRCGSALPGEYAWLRNAMAEYIEEELGHEEWILSDIDVCGTSADMVRNSYPESATEDMIAYAYYAIDHIHPVSFLGMIFVLEGTSVDKATEVAKKLRESLGLPAKAFTYLSSHGSVDEAHISFLESLLNQVRDKNHQAMIIHMAKRMYHLFGETISCATALQTKGVAA